MPQQQIQRRRRKSDKDNQPTKQKLPSISFSQRGTFKRCHWKWWMEYEERWSPIRDAPALVFGTWMHKALAAYYKPGLKRGPKPWLTFEKVYAEAAKKQLTDFGFHVEEDDKWVSAAELGPAMLRHYVEHYTSGVPKIADDEIEVVVTEKRFETIIPHPETGEPWFRFVGVIDNVWRHLPTKRLYIVDHKTAAAINTRYLSLDQQSTGYWTYGVDWLIEQGLLPDGAKLDGILFNILRKAKKDERPQNETGQYLNQDGAISQKQPAPYFARIPIMRDVNERDRLKNRLLVEFADIERVRRGGVREAYKNEGQFTCPGCWLFDICELHEIGLDWQGMAEHTVREWEPYDPEVVYEMETH